MPINNSKSCHKHNTDECFEAILKEAQNNSQTYLSNSNGTLESDKQLKDHYQAEEQKERARAITTILRHYETSYSNKVFFQRRYRKIIFWGCGSIIVLFTGTVLFVMIYTICNVDKVDLSGIATAITAMITLVVSIIELIRTIIRYCFPENDDEYIVKIVESIQGNDLEQTKEANRSAEAREKSHKKDETKGMVLRLRKPMSKK